ncbi:MAG: ral substrate transporter:Major facilitator superfamily 1, partial [Betaproteobacteria bacterium]|nr:ral substrate transporter:Major facilitator superfamily 1 [Betaproteobacteria bacterium]
MSSVSPDSTLSARVPRGVWVLGFVSLLMDLSSELIHSLLPVFMVTGLGASAFVVGIVEGVAEATALIVRVFSGALSDYFGKRKALAIAGYGLGALSKPLFALATSIGWVLTARFIDRIGKGTRGAPRDALIADLTPPEIRGAAYGLRQTLDTVGAFLGPLLAVALMLLFAGDFRSVFWVAVVPGFLSVTLLIVGIRESERAAGAARAANPLHLSSLREFGPAYWWIVLAGGVFTLARFSEAFLLLRAQQQGLPDTYAPFVLVLMNVVFALTAYPMGRLADRVNPTALLGAGLAVLIAADIVLARATALSATAAGVALWGLHMGMTQGVLSAMVAGNSPPLLRGTAFGLFNLVSGIAMLIASVLAGFLWDRYGAPTTFYA